MAARLQHNRTPLLIPMALILSCSTLMTPNAFSQEETTLFIPQNPIDTHLLAGLEALGLSPAPRCSDAVFIRRVYIDVLGMLPTPQEVRAFLRAQHPKKRAVLIDELLEREEYAEYWALHWCDILRVKAEFPINLWPNAVQAYHHWVRQALRENMPYDHFARALLTSSGSNFRVPPVNFYRAIQGQDPETIATAVALTFMGARTGAWSAEERSRLAAFFSRVAYKRTAEWKEEIVYLNPEPSPPIETRFPNGIPVRILPQEDPREVFCNWLVGPDNPYFTKAIANRIWAWLMGRGLIHEADDIRADNPPLYPALLDYLEQELINAQYDLKHLYRLILNSSAYQQSSLHQEADRRASDHFAVYPVRRLEAEVLIDALNTIFGSGESYSSPIPEPFTYIPNTQATVALADGSISSQFLEMFGRPTRDTGVMAERNNQPTNAQRLHLLNSSHIQKKMENSWRLKQLKNILKRRPDQAFEMIYLAILSRLPSAEESEALSAYLKESDLEAKDALQDIAWALINSKEFLYRH